MNPYLTSCDYAGLVAVPLVGANAQSAPGDVVEETGDAASNTFTAEILDLGEYFFGALTSFGDSDWIAITLDAGIYTIAGVGADALDSAVNNIGLTLRNDSGDVIDFDDVSGPGSNAQLTITVNATTLYFIDVGAAVSATDFGAYGVSVVEGTTANYNDLMASSNLMRFNEAWTSTVETGANITWAIRGTGVDTTVADPDGFDPDGFAFVAPTAGQAAVIALAMGYLDEISGLNFTQVNPTGTSNAATILFGAYNDPSINAGGAYAYFPGSPPGATGNASYAGDVWLNTDDFDNDIYFFGDFKSYAILHEIGHAIGLAHPGEYNAGGGGPITYSNNAAYTKDSQQYTVMSYFDESNTGASGGFDYPDTFMLHDFMAIHRLYGADETYNAGDTVYGFNATEANSVYDFTVNTNPFMTVYDGDGIDTIDLSGYTMAQFLTLEAGAFSDIGGYVGRFSIAYGAEIENAIGGSGDDTIMGNDGDNTINGGAGADSILGGLGNDSLFGGTQFDHLEGGAGNDTLVGEMGNDTLLGGDDRDLLSGGNGNDYMDGENGNDRIIGGRGDDVLLGSGGIDRLIGGAEHDLLDGGIGNDLLRGGTQNDTLLGGSGNDTMIGGAGFDSLTGGEDNDLMSGAFNADRFVFANGHGNDTITDFEATNSLEKIEFKGISTLNTLADVLGTGDGTAAAKQVGADVVITTGVGASILLQNVLYTDLDAADFVF